jgi:hypothetical protein
MATFTLDKGFWRMARLLLWSLIVALAVGVFFGVVHLDASLPGFTAAILVFGGLWVVVYHLFERIRG